MCLFPEMSRSVLSPNFHIHVKYLLVIYRYTYCIPRIGLPILLQPKWQTNPENIYNCAALLPP